MLFCEHTWILHIQTSIAYLVRHGISNFLEASCPTSWSLLLPPTGGLILIDANWCLLMLIDPDWWSESDTSENTSCKLVYNFDEKDKIIRWQYITCGSPWSVSLLSDWIINKRVQNFGAIVGSQHLIGICVRTIQCFFKTSYRDFLCFDIFKQAVQTCEQAYTSYAYGA